jgi:hypothetical protein
MAMSGFWKGNTKNGPLIKTWLVVVGRAHWVFKSPPGPRPRIPVSTTSVYPDIGNAPYDGVACYDVVLYDVASHIRRNLYPHHPISVPAVLLMAHLKGLGRMGVASSPKVWLEDEMEYCVRK